MKKHPSHSVGGGQQAGEPDLVRELLDAGRAEHAAVSGYDVEAGLARHLAQVQTGAPLPDWAQGLVKGAGAAAAGGAVGTGAKLASKLATGKLLPWIAMSLLAAGVTSVVVLSSPQSGTVAAPVLPSPMQVTPIEGAHAQTGTETGAENGAEGGASETIEPSAADTRVEPNADEVLAGVKRGVAARRAASRSAQSTAAKTADDRSVDALMGAEVSKRSSSEGRSSSDGTVKLAAHAATDRTNVRTNEPAHAEAQGEQAAIAAKNEPVAQPQPVAPATLDDSRLEREMGMLAMAQRVLTSDPDRALRLARQGEQEFAGSMFTQERQQVLLLALIQLGRMPEAKRLAQPYLKRYPNGPFSDRLRRALVAGKLASESSRDINN